MLLSIEYKNDSKVSDQGEVEIYCDKEGIEYLIKKLELLKKNGGHEHFMTPSWAGNELTETKQGSENILFHHLCVMLKPE